MSLISFFAPSINQNIATAKLSDLSGYLVLIVVEVDDGGEKLVGRIVGASPSVSAPADKNNNNIECY